MYASSTTMAKWFQKCHSRDDAYRYLITTISSRINDLREVKFQCRDHVGRGALERVDTVLGLFEILEERDIICQEDVGFLAVILNNIRRKDLAKMVTEYMQNWLRPTVDPVYQYHISNNLKKVTADGIDLSSKAFSGFANSGNNFGDQQTVLAVPFSGVEAPEVHETAHLPPHEVLLGHRDTVIQEPLRGLIDFLSDQLTYSWQTVMRNLFVTESVIQRSMLNWPHSVQNQIKETLEYWARNGPGNNVESIIDALRVSGRNDLGDMVTARFQPGRRPMTGY